MEAVQAPADAPGDARVSSQENNAQEQVVSNTQQSSDTNPLESSVEIVNEENLSPNKKKRKRLERNNIELSGSGG